jgi:hypothetical protein
VKARCPKHCSLSPSFRAEEAGGKFNRSWPGEDSADHSHYAYDAIPEATISRLHDAGHFWRPGHKTFSGFIKARERPQQRGERSKRNEKPEKKNPEHRGRRNRTGKKKRKNKETRGQENKQRLHREGEKGRGESQISPAIVFVPAEKEQQRTKDY